MSAHMLICETVAVAKEPSDRLTEAVRARDRAKAALDKRLEELGEVIADEVRSGVMQSKVAKVAKYTPEHVRRIARAHGVEGDPSRVPPPAPPRKPPAD